MRKYPILIAVSIALAGCNPPVAQSTAPGAPLPSGLAFCTGHDIVGRCTGWTSESDRCVNPKGINEPDPIVPCASIRKKPGSR